MRGIIYYESSWENGNKKLKEIIKQYSQIGISVIECHCNKITSSWAEFENGDIWKVIKANDSARGYRCNIAYIERCISYNIYRCIIAPKVLDFPYSAIHLWGEGDLHISNELSLPF